MDARYKPMLCESAEAIPADAGAWVLEPKFDGWRTIVVVQPTGAVLLYGGRNGNAYSGKVPYVEQALAAALPPGTAIDGELVCPSGWGGVQSAMTSGAPHVPSALSPALTLVAFDVLEVNGQDVRALTWEQRRQILEMIAWPNFTYLSPTGDASVGSHARMLDLGMEGSVVKRRASTYRPGARSRDWLKLKAIGSEDCTVVGFDPGEGEFAGMIGAIRFRTPRGVESSASGMTLAERQRMTADPDAYVGRIVEIVHNGVMASGKLRHPRFKRMRDDRSPAPAPKPKPARRRAPRGGPWMRNYKAMTDAKLAGCVRELVFGHGDAYQRVIDHGGDLSQHIRVAREEAMSRGLAVPALT